MYKKLLHHSKKLFEKIKKKQQEEKRQTKEVSKQALETYLQKLSLEKKTQTVISEISLLSALKIIAVLLGIFLAGNFIIATSDILLSFFFSLFLASVLFTSVQFFENRHIPRIISILISFVLIFGFLGLLISNIIPAVIDQSIALGNWFLQHVKLLYNGDFSKIPEWFQQFGPHMQDSLLQIDEYMKSLQTDGETQQGLLQVITDNISKFKPWQDGILTTIYSVFSSLFSFILIMVMTFFILLERDSIYSFFLKFFSPHLQNYIGIKGIQIQEKISGWIHAQMILFLFMGGITWAFFSLIGIEYALTIGFIAGVAEFIPYLGPFLTFLIGTPIAFGMGWETGIAVIIFFGVLQFVEGNILIPLIMEKAVGISALVTVIALIIGFQLLGVVGAIIAIPVVAIIGIFIEDIQQYIAKKK